MAHLDGVIDHGISAPKREAALAAEDGNNAKVNVVSQPSVEQNFSLTKVMALVESREIKETKVNGPFQFEDVRMSDEDQGSMCFD